MLFKDVKDMIAEIGLPYAYYAFPENTEQDPPYVIFWYPQNDDYVVDDQNYIHITVLYVELYTSHKNTALENTVEAVLKEHEMVYEKAEESIDSELLTLVRYSMEVIINA